MSRIRTIKPEYWNDEKLSKISRDARLTFVGLWTASDDYGVVKGHPTWLRNQIYPFEELSQKLFNQWLDELEKIKVIIPFIYNRERYYFIRNFTKHQRVDHPSTTRNPEAPPDILANDSRETLDALANDSPLSSSSSSSSKVVIKDNVHFDFEEIWKNYPNKVGKKESFKHFKATVKTKYDFDNLKIALKKYIDSDRVQKGFIQNGNTWFNNWKDWIDYKEPDQELNPPKPQTKICFHCNQEYPANKKHTCPPKKPETQEDINKTLEKIKAEAELQKKTDPIIDNLLNDIAESKRIKY